MAGGAEVDVYVDGELLDTIDQDSSGLDYQEAWGYCGLESGQTHVLVLRQNTGTLMDVDAFFLENNPISDDDNQLISYGIGWISYLGNGPYDGSIHYSEMVGSQAEVTFSGTSVGLFYTSSSNRGVLQIQIDGVTVAYLNQYAVETQYQQYWTANGLRDGTHKITFIHASGTLVDIDGIWVEEILPARFTGAEYTYDGDGNLVKSEVNGVVTYYLGKYYEKTVQNEHTAEKKHYSAGSSMIAVRTVIDGTQDTLNWLVGDHLGSTSLVTDSAGVVVSEVRYSAFGEMRYLNGETVTDLLYTGQKLEEELGLYYYVARWYDPYLNRFLSPDSIIPDPGSSAAYDRYVYVNNNPLKYSDPSGHYLTTEDSLFDGDSYENSEGQSIHPELINNYYLFIRLPVDLEVTVGVQWFGRTERAYDLKVYYNDEIYAYCQYAHCGLDLLAPYGTPVYAGVYGSVVFVSSISKNNPQEFEGPWKIQIKVGDYVITYGHTNGYSNVEVGDYVTPSTIISGVGNMGGNSTSGEIDHLHLEIRGPGGWAGYSQNPLNYMNQPFVQDLIEVATNQQTEIEMGRFFDGSNSYIYTDNLFLNPQRYSRYYTDFPY